MAIAVAMLLLVACGRQTIVEHASVPKESTTTTTVPYDGRLHVAVVPGDYAEDSNCACSWRMDPAPADTQPTLTLDEVRAANEQRGVGPGQQPRYYFGLYSGNVPNPNAPDGRLTGVHRVDAVPAWLVVTDNVEIVSYGPGNNPPAHGWSWTQLYDAPGAPPVFGSEETGGDPPAVY